MAFRGAIQLRDFASGRPAAEADADRMTIVLAGLEALVASAGSAASDAPNAPAPPVQVVVQQCPDRGEGAAGSDLRRRKSKDITSRRARAAD